MLEMAIEDYVCLGMSEMAVEDYVCLGMSEMAIEDYGCSLLLSRCKSHNVALQ